MYDAELYRTKDEVNRWKQRDPIHLFVAAMRQQGFIQDSDMALLEERAAAEVADAVAIADAGPLEPLDDLTKDVSTPAGVAQ